MGGFGSTAGHDMRILSIPDTTGIRGFYRAASHWGCLGRRRIAMTPEGAGFRMLAGHRCAA
jgi:hypothetical protein